MKSRLMLGYVWHRRHRPVVNEFRQRVLYLDLALDELPELDTRLRLFSRNRLNAYAINDRDHHGDDGRGIVNAMTRHVEEAGVGSASLRMITQPSAFGYVFNPISFLLTPDSDLVVVEVHNRHRGRHLYDLRPESTGDALRASFEKQFYVSPFISMDSRYQFSMSEDSNRAQFRFDQSDEGGLLFQAHLDLRPKRLTDAALARALLTHPVVPWRTVAGIYLQAIKLKLKGLHYSKPGDRQGPTDVAG